MMCHMPAASPKPFSIDTDQVHLLQVLLVKGRLDATDAYVANPQPPTSISFHFGQGFGMNRSKKTCRFILEITMEGHGTDEELLGVQAAYTLDFRFLVDNFEDYVMSGKKESFHLHPMLGSTLLGIAFSTARGIILERTKGSYLDGVILPIVSPMKLLFDAEQHSHLESAKILSDVQPRHAKQKTPRSKSKD